MNASAIPLLVLMFFAAEVLHAQDGRHDEPTMQANFIWALPQGEMADHLDRTPLGASLTVGAFVPDAPVFLGTELSLLNYGKYQDLRVHGIEDFPAQAIVVSSSHHIAMAHLVGRVHLPVQEFRPYVEAVAGLRTFVSRTELDSDVIVFRRGMSATSHTKDTAFSYGIGGGIDLVLHAGRTGFYDRWMTVSVNAAVRYLFGSDADFVGNGPVREENGRYVFDSVRSATNMIVPQIGVVVSM